MKCTIKSVNQNLDRLDFLDRGYYTTKHIGNGTETYGRLKCAFADYDENGQCCGTYVYAYGEVMPERHYYGVGRTVNITEIIENFVDREYGYDRHFVCCEIADAITADIKNGEEEEQWP